MRRHSPDLLVLAGTAGGLLAFFLAIYVARRYPMPIGWDTPRYISQTNFVAERGLSGVPHLLPPPIKTLASRAGFPVMALTLGGLLGQSTFLMAAMVPAAAAVALALASGAVVSWTLRRGVWELVATAVVVGTSTVVIRLMAPETYTDNLLAAAVFVAALVPTIAAVRDGRGFVAAAALFAVGGMAHAPFLGVMLGILALTAALYAPASWRRFKGGASLSSTPTARLAMVGGGAGALTALGIFGLLRTGPDQVKLTPPELAQKLREDLPLYRLPLILPVAALGAAVLARVRVPSDSTNGAAPTALRPVGRARERDGFGPRFLLALLLAWSAVVGGGVAAYYLGADSPAHRFLSFWLALPILAAIGLLGAGRLVAAVAARRGGARVGRVAGAAVVAAGVGLVAFLGYRTYYVTLPRTRGVEWLQVDKVRDAATAASYLERAGIAATAPVVFVVDDSGPKPEFYVPEMAYMLRSALPVDRVQHTFIYAGDPDRYLAGLPTYRPSPVNYDLNENRFWPSIRALLPRRPVALLLASFNPAYERYAADHAQDVAAPGLAVLAGPRLGSAIPRVTAPIGPIGRKANALVGLGVIAALSLIGVGWALALLPSGVRPFEVAALSLAFGIALLLVGGILADAVGIRLQGSGGAVTSALVAVTGWAAAAIRLRRT